MSKKHVFVGALVLAVGGFTIADNIPDDEIVTFEPLTPLSSADMNANFDALQAGVNDNDGRITTNAADITANESDIGDNASNITTNASRLDTLEAGGTGGQWAESGDDIYYPFAAGVGNVGIGSVSPLVRLTIESGHESDAIPTLGTVGGGFYLSNANELYGLMAGVTNGGSAWLQSQRTDGAATAYNLLLNPSGGNVGVGTTIPTVPLQVEGNSSGGIIISRSGFESWGVGSARSGR